MKDERGEAGTSVLWAGKREFERPTLNVQHSTEDASALSRKH